MIQVKRHDHSNELLKELSLIAFDYKVYKELGYPVFSDKNHKWYLIYKNTNLIGFCASIIKNGKTKFVHDYVIESERSNGYYHILFFERFKDSKGEITAVATHKSISKFLEFGFEIQKETKNYTFIKTIKK